MRARAKTTSGIHVATVRISSTEIMKNGGRGSSSCSSVPSLMGRSGILVLHPFHGRRTKLQEHAFGLHAIKNRIGGIDGHKETVGCDAAETPAGEQRVI